MKSKSLKLDQDFPKVQNIEVDFRLWESFEFTRAWTFCGTCPTFHEPSATYIFSGCHSFHRSELGTLQKSKFRFWNLKRGGRPESLLEKASGKVLWGSQSSGSSLKVSIVCGLVNPVWMCGAHWLDQIISVQLIFIYFFFWGGGWCI